MPIIRSAKKKLRQDKKRENQNLLVKRLVKTAITKFRKKPAAGELAKVFGLIDDSVKKNVFHKNKGARLKSRLAKLLGKPAAKTEVKKAAPAKKPRTKKNATK